MDASLVRYFAFGAILRPLVGGRRGELDKGLELIVLRHQLTVLRRRGERPKLKPADRAFKGRHRQ
jgi:hypothetical protein